MRINKILSKITNIILIICCVLFCASAMLQAVLFTFAIFAPGLNMALLYTFALSGVFGTVASLL